MELTQNNMVACDRFSSGGCSPGGGALAACRRTPALENACAPQALSQRRRMNRIGRPAPTSSQRFPIYCALHHCAWGFIQTVMWFRSTWRGEALCLQVTARLPRTTVSIYPSEADAPLAVDATAVLPWRPPRVSRRLPGMAIRDG